MGATAPAVANRPAGAAARSVDDGTTTRSRKGEWTPRVVAAGSPLFSRPWRLSPRAAAKALFGWNGYLWPTRAADAALALLTWFVLQPGAGIWATQGAAQLAPLAPLAELRPGWILLMYARNVALLLIVAGGWHLRLYYRRAQGTRFKYTSRWPATDSKAFLFGHQVWDNMFWSLTSGAMVWTLYEALMMWAYARGWLPWLGFVGNPVWFVALFLLLPIWNDIHFYLVYGVSHWKPLYRAAHYLHHRNINVGPWSGMAMHPIEHLLYLSRWLIFLILPAHPVHMLYVMQRTGVGPATGHTGFDQVVVHTPSDTRMSIDSFYHYLHHRYHIGRACMERTKQVCVCVCELTVGR